MWKNLIVSLYDLFGYFFPGAIACLALGVLLWALSGRPLLIVPFSITTTVGVVLLFVAYLAGHLVQGLANLVLRSRPRALEAIRTLPDILKIAVTREVDKIYDLKSSELDEQWLCRLVEHSFTRIGKVDDRVIFEAREGFYRGLVISFALLSLALFVKLLTPGAAVQVDYVQFRLPWTFILPLAILCLAACPLVFRRYKRFARYKYRESILGFLAARRLDPGPKAG